MTTARQYMGASAYYEGQIHQISDPQERLVYATLAQQQATLAVAAAILEQTVAITHGSGAGVRVVND